MKKADSQPVDVIQDWFKTHCDGLWEHHHGLKLETTDNPGWLLTIDQDIGETAFNALAVEARKRWNAEFVLEKGKEEVFGEVVSPLPVQVIKLKKDKLKIYAASLTDSLSVAAYILTNLKPAK